MRQEIVTSYKAEIFIAGPIDVARSSCRKYCDEVGLCVTVTPTDYIYTGGQEQGVIIGLINYGRFPASTETILKHAVDLGHLLMEDMNQQSFTVQDGRVGYWHSKRTEDQ